MTGCHLICLGVTNHKMYLNEQTEKSKLLHVTPFEVALPSAQHRLSFSLMQIINCWDMHYILKDWQHTCARKRCLHKLYHFLQWLYHHIQQHANSGSMLPQYLHLWHRMFFVLFTSTVSCCHCVASVADKWVWSIGGTKPHVERRPTYN
jgi:hypothetical protein